MYTQPELFILKLYIIRNVVLAHYFNGFCDTDRPGMFDLQGKAKWDAWNGRKGQH